MSTGREKQPKTTINSLNLLSLLEIDVKKNNRDRARKTICSPFSEGGWGGLLHLGS